jgi:branched-chain amino acid transport system ATP-binding protein
MSPLEVDRYALQAQHLTKYFGGVKVLEDISFDVPAGERLAIIGPNGAGKTTLLNLINGQISPTGGKILFFGEDITGTPTHRRAHIGQARTFQLSNLFLNLSVMENVELFLHGLRKSRYDLVRSVRRYGQVRESAAQLLDEAGLWERRSEPLGTLAYGDQRRLEIDLCMACEPRLLLMDEPSNGLTREQGQQVVDLINQHIGREVTVLVVAHDMELVFRVADRIMVLFEGEIIACDTCDIVGCDPRVREIYMGA